MIAGVAIAEIRALVYCRAMRTITNIYKKLAVGGLLAGLTLAPVMMAPAAHAESKCAGVETAVLSCSDDKGGESTVMWLLKVALMILTWGAGILAAIGLMVGGIMWTTAGDNANQVARARQIILNVVIGLLLYIFLFAITNFLIPGGIFS